MLGPPIDLLRKISRSVTQKVTSQRENRLLANAFEVKIVKALC
jgi:hypothetical protein